MRLTDFNEKITAKSLNEGLVKKYGQRIAVENYTLEELHSARNKLRTQMRDIETNESFNAVDGPVYQKTKSFLDVLNAEIHERENIQEAGKPDFLDLDKDGNKKEPMKKAAKDAKGGKKSPEGKKGMSDKQKKYFGKKNESVNESPEDKKALDAIQAILDKIGLTKEKQDELRGSMDNTQDAIRKAIPSFGDKDKVMKKGKSSMDDVMKKGFDSMDGVMKKGMDSMKNIQDKFKSNTSNMMKRAGFESEERTDELLPAAIAIGGAGWAAYEIYNAIKEYQEDGDEAKLAKAIGSEAAYAIAGGMIAKGISLAGKSFMKASGYGSLGGASAAGAIAMDPDFDESIEEDSLAEDARELMAFIKAQGIEDVEPKLQLAIRDYFYDKKQNAPAGGGADADEKDWDWKAELEKEAEIFMKQGYSKEEAYKAAYKDIRRRRLFRPGGDHHRAMKALDKKAKDLRARKARGEIPTVSSDEMDKIRARSDQRFKDMAKGTGIESMEETVAANIVNALMEGEEEKAALVMASKDMVDKVTSWMEDTAEMQTESMLELGDKIRDEQDSATSEQFINTVKPALEALFTALETARGQLSSGVAIVTGEGDDMMGGDTSMDMDVDADDDMEPTVDMEGDDEFGVADASAGGEEEAGREKRESIERSRKLGTLLSKKK